MLRVKKFIPGRLAKNWNAPAPIIYMSGFDNEPRRGGVDRGGDKRGGGEGFGTVVGAGASSKEAFSDSP